MVKRAPISWNGSHALTYFLSSSNLTYLGITMHLIHANSQIHTPIRLRLDEAHTVTLQFKLFPKQMFTISRNENYILSLEISKEIAYDFKFEVMWDGCHSANSQRFIAPK